MAKKDEKTVDEQREMREELMKSAAFRKFVVGLMVKARYLKAIGGDIGDYERGKKDSLYRIISEFVIGTDGGKSLVAEYLDFIKTDKKEY